MTASSTGVRLPDGRMPLIDHLRELRRRLTWSVIAFGVMVAVAYALWHPLFLFLREPYCQAVPRTRCTLIVTGVFDQFNVRMKVAFIGGAVGSAPIWLYQVGAFITPALHKAEKRYAALFLTASLALFAIGASVAYLSLGHALSLLLHVAGSGVTNLTSLKDYLSFVTLLLVLFGLAFEFPVVIVFLHLVGVLSSTRMRAWRRGMVFCLFAAAAVLTPSTDPFTFLALGIPLYVMYEACILIARVHERRLRRRQAADPLTQLDDDLPSSVDTTPSPL